MDNQYFLEKDVKIYSFAHLLVSYQSKGVRLSSSGNLFPVLICLVVFGPEGVLPSTSTRCEPYNRNRTTKSRIFIRWNFIS